MIFSSHCEVSENRRGKKDKKHGENCTIKSPLCSIRMVKPRRIRWKNMKGLIDMGKIPLKWILHTLSDCGLQFADSLLVLVAGLVEGGNKPSDVIKT